MAKSLISWVVVGALAFVWYRVGYGIEFLQDSPRGSWEPTWVLYTLMVLVILRRPGGAANDGENVVEAIVNRVRGIVPHLLGLVVALLVGLTVFSLEGGAFVQKEYFQAIIISLGAAITTAAWLGALEDASS